jgi:hypothetical protein
MIEQILIGWASLLLLYTIKKTIKYTLNYLYYKSIIIFKLYILYLCLICNILIFVTTLLEHNSLENILLSSIITNLFLIILFSLIIQYLNIINTDSNKNIWYILCIISFLNTIILSLLEYFIDYTLYKSIKVIIYNFIIIIISYKINLVLIHTKQILLEGGHSIKKAQLNIIIFNVSITALILYQFITSIINLTETNNSHLIDNIVYPIVEIIFIIILICFFIKKSKEYTITTNNPIYIS